MGIIKKIVLALLFMIFISLNHWLYAAIGSSTELDVVFANKTQQNKLYQEDSDASNSFIAIATVTNDTTAIAVGDLNGDGKNDLIFANSNQVNTVYLNNGAGSFVPGNDVSANTNNSSALALGDINGNGILDLVVANYGQENIIYLGQGDGTFIAGINVTAVTDDTTSVVLSDINGDSKLDLIFGNNAQQNIAYLGNGDGTFVPAQLFADTNNTLAIAVVPVSSVVVAPSAALALHADCGATPASSSPVGRSGSSSKCLVSRSENSYIIELVIVFLSIMFFVSLACRKRRC